MTRKEAMELLEEKTTQELLSKQLLWQFQIAAIEDEKGPKVKKRIRELKKEFSWIQEVIGQRKDTKKALRERFGDDVGSLVFADAGLTCTSWEDKISTSRVDFYDAESASNLLDSKSNPRVKVIHNDEGKPPQQIIGMNTLDLAVKRGSEG